METKCVELNGKVFELEGIFSGIQKFTTVDFPGKTAITLFTGGCNFRCVYCHNPSLVLPERVKFLDLNEIVSFLFKRRGLVEGVVVCGGEPSIHKNLIVWIRFLKELGFKVKLDTNASNSVLVEQVIEEKLVDMFAIDYKAPANKYSVVIARQFDGRIVLENISKIVMSGVEYEIRTTIHNGLHSKEDILQMFEELKSVGVKNYYLQNYKEPLESVGGISGGQNTHMLLNEFKESLGSNFLKFGLRNMN